MSILSAVLFFNKHTFLEVYVLPHTTLMTCFPLQLGSLAGTWKTKPVCILMMQEMVWFWMAVALAGPCAKSLTSLQTVNCANTSLLNLYGPDVFLMPNQQCKSTESNIKSLKAIYLTKYVLHFYRQAGWVPSQHK